MMRSVALTCLLSATSLLLAQPKPSSPQPSTASATRPMPVPPTTVAADAPVVTVHGLCPAGPSGTPAKKEDCTTVLTRSQFESFIASINVTNQTYTPAAQRNLASGYINVMALAEAAEEAGVDKDPRFQEIMKVARNRSLADAYHRYLQEKYGNPSQQEIEQYYKDNLARFDQVKIERILIPRVNPKRPQDRPGEFEKRARQVADAIRERAAHGEDISALQAEAYKELALQTMPPQTDLPPNYKIAQTGAQQDVNALKPGEVTKVEVELSGFTIYKLKSRNTLTVDQARNQIVKELSEKNIDHALKAATGGIKADFNEEFFNPKMPFMANPRVLPGSVPTGHTGTQMVLPPSQSSQTPAAPK